jgi:hypothetical protein
VARVAKIHHSANIEQTLQAFAKQFRRYECHAARRVPLGREHVVCKDPLAFGGSSVNHHRPPFAGQ